MTDSKYGKVTYVGFDKTLKTNYDQYYYYYSAERNPDYYTDENYGVSEDETFKEWLDEMWSHDTSKIVVFVFIGVIASTILMWASVKIIGECALDFRPKWVKEQEEEKEESELEKDEN